MLATTIPPTFLGMEARPGTWNAEEGYHVTYRKENRSGVFVTFIPVWSRYPYYVDRQPYDVTVIGRATCFDTPPEVSCMMVSVFGLLHASGDEQMTVDELGPALEQLYDELAAAPQNTTQWMGTTPGRGGCAIARRGVAPVRGRAVDQFGFELGDDGELRADYESAGDRVSVTVSPEMSRYLGCLLGQWEVRPTQVGRAGCGVTNIETVCVSIGRVEMMLVGSDSLDPAALGAVANEMYESV